MQPLILSVDTSGEALGVLISQGASAKHVHVVSSPRDHCKHITNATKDALRVAGLALEDFDAFGCVVGPGSFTGLRIGMIHAKTLAFVFQKPLVGVTTFERMVMPSHAEGTYYVWPAQKNHLYWTSKPLDPENYAFGNKDAFDPKGEDVVGPQGMEMATGLPFETICGTPMASRLFEKYKQQEHLDVAHASPLYVQEVAAKANLRKQNA